MLCLCDDKNSISALFRLFSFRDPRYTDRVAELVLAASQQGGLGGLVQTLVLQVRVRRAAHECLSVCRSVSWLQQQQHKKPRLLSVPQVFSTLPC